VAFNITYLLQGLSGVLAWLAAEFTDQVERFIACQTTRFWSVGVVLLDISELSDVWLSR
jgi:hypothetical protein